MKYRKQRRVQLSLTSLILLLRVISVQKGLSLLACDNNLHRTAICLSPGFRSQTNLRTQGFLRSFTFVGSSLSTTSSRSSQQCSLHCTGDKFTKETNRLPSVSVQIVTYQRPRLLMESLAQIWVQDYTGPLEVVVIDDSHESMEDSICEFARCADMHIIYRHLQKRYTLGGKRNIAALATTADVICIWDDDDIFPNNRISRQVQDLLAGHMCSFIETVYYYSAPKHALNIHNKHVPILPIENTLCFWKSWFERGRKFQLVNFGEGMWLFEYDKIPDGARALGPNAYDIMPKDSVRVPAVELPFLYVKHGSSVSGDDVLSTKLRRYEVPCGAPDGKVFALGRALMMGEFPPLKQLPVHTEVLCGVRSAVSAEISRDLDILKARGDIQLTYDYWKALASTMLNASTSSADLRSSKHKSLLFEKYLAAIRATIHELSLDSA